MEKSTWIYLSGAIEIFIALIFMALVLKVITLTDAMQKAYPQADYIIILMITLILASNSYDYWCRGIDQFKIARECVKTA